MPTSASCSRALGNRECRSLGRTFARVKSTGKKFDSEWAHVFTIKGGKIKRFQEFYDTAAIVDAIACHLEALALTDPGRQHLDICSAAHRLPDATLAQ
jgi:hypothetical protein